jgi:hypothetical protein
MGCEIRAKGQVAIDQRVDADGRNCHRFWFHPVLRHIRFAIAPLYLPLRTRAARSVQLSRDTQLHFVFSQGDFLDFAGKASFQPGSTPAPRTFIEIFVPQRLKTVHWQAW